MTVSRDFHTCTDAEHRAEGGGVREMRVYFSEGEVKSEALSASCLPSESFSFACLR